MGESHRVSGRVRFQGRLRRDVRSSEIQVLFNAAAATFERDSFAERRHLRFIPTWRMTLLFFICKFIMDLAFAHPSTAHCPPSGEALNITHLSPCLSLGMFSLTNGVSIIKLSSLSNGLVPPISGEIDGEIATLLRSNPWPYRVCTAFISRAVAKD
jgi:hypothetical protein